MKQNQKKKLKEEEVEKDKLVKLVKINLFFSFFFFLIDIWLKNELKKNLNNENSNCRFDPTRLLSFYRNDHLHLDSITKHKKP